MMSSVSTHLCSSLMPPSAMRMRRWPSNWNGFVTTPTVRMPSSLAQRATTGAAPVPVPPPMPAVTNTMWAPARWSRISSITSSAAARPTSGCEPAPSPSVTRTPIWMMRSALDMVSACASVLATTKSQPTRPAVIMLLTALPPAPPTPNTVIRGLSSRISGTFRSIVMAASPERWRECRRVGPVRRRPARSYDGQSPLEALAKPSSHPREITFRPGHELSRAPRFELFEMRHLGVDQEPGRDRECRTFGSLGQSRDAERPAHAHPARENARGGLGQPRELARAAGQHHARTRIRRKRRGGEPVAHHFQNFLDAGADDAHEGGAGDDVRRLALVLADRRHRDHVAIVRGAGDRASVQRLDAFGVGELGVQAARQIHGDVIAAEREGIRIDEPPLREHRDRGGAGTDIDDCRAEVRFIVGEDAQSGRIGRAGHGLDREMAAF